MGVSRYPCSSSIFDWLFPLQSNHVGVPPWPVDTPGDDPQGPEVDQAAVL